jgi:tripartite-type tricarboxylate transporter receptor subunit TctC
MPAKCQKQTFWPLFDMIDGTSSRGVAMKLPRRKFLHLAVGATALSALSDTALALDYPTRPVHWIIGFPPGGGADIVARILGAWLAERLGQQVIIENRPGAGTNIATEYVVHSAADGYTLLWAGVSNAINASIFSDLSFDFLKDIAPVSGVVAYPLMIEVNPQVPAKNIAELIALAKASPGKLTLASYGTGTISQVAGELFKLRAGIEMVHIPYKGGAPMLTDLLSGHVNAAINVVASDLPHVRSGAVRALATLGLKRLDALPDACPHSPRLFRDTKRWPSRASASRRARRPRSSRGSTARSMPASPIRGSASA